MCKPPILYQRPNRHIAHGSVGLGKHCYLASYLAGIHLKDIFSIQHHLSRARPDVSADCPHQCGFSTAVRTDNRIDFSLLDVEGNILDNLVSLITNTQMVDLHYIMFHRVTSAADTRRTVHPTLP